VVGGEAVPHSGGDGGALDRTEGGTGGAPKIEPTYAEAFPPLPMTADGGEPSLPSSPKVQGAQWNKMSLKSSTTTQVINISKHSPVHR